MQKIFLSALVLCQIIGMGCSQATKETNQNPENIASEKAADNGLKVTMELAPADPANPGQMRSFLTITNNTNETLPASGWKLYFNGGRVKAGNENLVILRQFNGDLHYLTPGPGFTELQPGKSFKTEMLSGTLRNLTDFPRGFYLVYDKEPTKGLPVALEVKTGNYFTKLDQQIAAKIYDQNAKIKPVAAEKLVKIFPTPVSYQETGAPFTLTETVAVVTDPDFQKEAEYLGNALSATAGRKLTIQTTAADKAIIFKKNLAVAPEGYELTVNANQVIITASSGAGAFYGAQSLLSLLPPTTQEAKPVQFPGLTVKDAPRFGYRGFMMDISRNFQPKSEVLKVLDLMALYKMNTFHLHFSDDEGWRLEIPSLPELTTVGATRAHTTDYATSISPSYGSGPDASNKAGTGFLSKSDFVQILKYANERHIQVIPEIESPGHARAAIKAMDARYNRLVKEGNKTEAEKYLLRDLKDKSVYRSVQGWNDNVMDVSQPSTYAFLERVVDDIREMYREAGAPLKTIHFGGDEVPGGVWEKSAAVQALIGKDATVKTTDDLWYYYFGKVNTMLKSRNLFLSGWEEIGLKKVKQNGKVTWITNPTFANEHFQVNVWKNSPGSGAEDLAYRMANAGYKVILTGVTHLYLDLAYNQSSGEPGLYWGGYVDIDKPFYFIPYNYLKNLKEDERGNPINPAIIKSREALTAQGKANIVGIEAPLWSETNQTPVQFEYKMLPKLLGVAERAWAKDPAWATNSNPAQAESQYNQAWSEFIHIVGTRELPRLDKYAGGFQYRVPTPGAKVVNGQVAANVQFPGLTIRYTVDGTEPTAQSAAYTKPIAAKGTVKLKAFTASSRASGTVTLENK